MEKTSERLDPEILTQNNESFPLLIFHKMSYELIQDYVKDKIVLDFGCGYGYGSQILKKYAKKVVGVDLSPDVIKIAREKYGQENLEFLLIDKLEKKGLMFQDKNFDVVVAFQVLEHIENIDLFFFEMKRILKDDGILILTTPNSNLRLLPFQTPWNHHHIIEFNYYELDSILAKYFDFYKIFGITFTGIPLKNEIGRITKLKIFLYPFTNVFVPNRLKLKILQFLWDIFRGKDILKIVSRKKRKPVFNERYLSRRVIITDDPRRKWLSFITFCYKK
ncbi:MAG: class I SAM-dependent methyltransferase [candidate division WOR-3 bacterium]